MTLKVEIRAEICFVDTYVFRKTDKFVYDFDKSATYLENKKSITHYFWILLNNAVSTDLVSTADMG